MEGFQELLHGLALVLGYCIITFCALGVGVCFIAGISHILNEGGRSIAKNLKEKFDA